MPRPAPAAPAAPPPIAAPPAAASPVQLAAAPQRFAAPVVAVASAPISAGTNWIGESVARAGRVQVAGAPAMHAPVAPTPVLQAPMPAQVYQAASALGGTGRAALPPPVPYSAR